MSKEESTCAPLAAALENASGALELTPELVNLIVVRIEEALADPRDGQLVGLKEQLSALLRSGIQHAPAAVVAALRQANKSQSAEGTSYLLGHLAMAQSLTARAWERRAGDNFEEELKSEGFAPYLRALLEGPATNVELAAKIGHTVETVSRRLRRLRTLGAADFRRDGVHTHNFLTPAAEALARSWALNSPLPPVRKKLEADVQQSLGELPEHMRHSLNFATQREGALAGAVH